VGPNQSPAGQIDLPVLLQLYHGLHPPSWRSARWFSAQPARAAGEQSGGRCAPMVQLPDPSTWASSKAAPVAFNWRPFIFICAHTHTHWTAHCALLDGPNHLAPVRLARSLVLVFVLPLGAASVVVAAAVLLLLLLLLL